MVQGLQELIRERSKIPLEALFASGLVFVTSFHSAILARGAQPFILCGHVYVIPPKEVYSAVQVDSSLTFGNSLRPVTQWCFQILFERDRRRQTAHMVPGVRTNVRIPHVPSTCVDGHFTFSSLLP